MLSDKIALVACGGVGVVLAGALVGSALLGHKARKERDHHLG